MNTNPMHLLLNSPAGTALLVLNEATHSTDFIIREDAAGMRHYPDGGVPCNACVVAEAIDGVLVIAIWVRLGTHWQTTFEVFINVCAPDNLGIEMLRRLATQPLFQVSFYVSDTRPVRQIGFRNRMQGQFHDLQQIAQTVPQWTMREFDEAKQKFQARYSPEGVVELMESSHTTVPTVKRSRS